MVRTGIVTGVLIQLAVLAALAGIAGLSIAGWLVGAGVGLGTAAILARALTESGASALGAANRVTLTRAALVGGVAALVADSFLEPTRLMELAAISTIALLLDAVDGQVARRTGTVTALGARFDMEVDAFLIFVLSVFVARPVGPWVLAIGAARYVFLAAGWFLPWLREPTPPRYWCKTVAAIQGIVLTIAVTNVFPGPAVDFLLAAALALLVESFGRDVWWLWSHRIPVVRRANGAAVPMAGAR
jgi:phosphatidylglycerophosphate synthase